MNNKFNNWLTIIVTGIVGVLFIVWYKEADLVSWLVRALGLCLVLPGIYVFIQSTGGRQPGHSQLSVSETDIEISDGRTAKKQITSHGRSASVSLMIVSVCTVLLGLWMLISPGFFVGLFSYILAAALIIYGIYQFVVVGYLARPAVLPWQFYVVPSLFIIAGLVIIVTPVHTINATVTLVTGILLVLAAINAAVQRFTLRSMYRKLNARQPEQPVKEIQERNDA